MKRNDPHALTPGSALSASQDAEPVPPSEIARHATHKPKGRPPGGIRLAAREAGVPEATYRRQMKLANANADIRTAPLSRAAKLRVIASSDAKQALDRESAKVGKRGLSELAMLRQENATLRAKIAELEGLLKLGRLEAVLDQLDQPAIAEQAPEPAEPIIKSWSDMSPSEQRAELSRQNVLGTLKIIAQDSSLPPPPKAFARPLPMEVVVKDMLAMLKTLSVQKKE